MVEPDKTVAYRVLGKVVQTEKLAKMLLDGVVYCRSLAFYRRLENGEPRKDRHDGHWSIIDNSRMLMNDPRLRRQFPHGIEPLYSVRSAADSRVFCTSLIDYSPWTRELRVPREIRKFGEWLVVIFDLSQFRNRVVTAATSAECTYITDAPVATLIRMRCARIQKTRLTICSSRERNTPTNRNIGSLSRLTTIPSGLMLAISETSRESIQ